MKPAFDTLRTFDSGDNKTGYFHSLPALEELGIGPISKLPVSIRIVLESVLRNCDGKKVRPADVEVLANWNAKAPAPEEIPFVVARIVLQDFTGVPLLVDLAAMRSAVQRLGGNPAIIEPLVPVDLVVDHSVQVDFYGSANALALNLEMEFKRNRERYQFLKWGQQAFDTFGVVPPGIGIVHQVNLEYLAKGVLSAPTTINGTDATIMVRGDGHSQAAAPGSAGSFLCLGPGWSSAGNAPFHRHKIWTHEGGISTPLIVQWPRGIAARGELRQNVGHVIDFVPTLLELAGVTPVLAKGAPALPGRSLVSAFAKDGSVTRDNLFFHHEGNRALRMGDYKLVSAREDRNVWELFNLTTDRCEQHNLATEQPERVRD
ncbi:MAG: aconitase family protein, partial [Terrimicrobiaceae bacterium]